MDSHGSGKKHKTDAGGKSRIVMTDYFTISDFFFNDVAYFQNWDSYQLRLLFSSYDITETWQFALTWFAVVFTVIIHSTLGYVMISFDDTMISALGGFEAPCGANIRRSICDNFRDSRKRLSRPVGWQSVKLVHALLSGVRYGLSLMQMLIAMTFNPSLFLALIVGRIVGEYMCCDYHHDLIMGAHRPISRYGGAAGRIIRSILCIATPEIIEEQEKLINHEEVQIYTKKAKLLRQSLWVLPRMISMILLVITIVWVMEVEGTFGFGSTSVFGWHALCMILFATVFTNEAVLTYTIPLFPQMVNDRKILRQVSFQLLLQSFCYQKKSRNFSIFLYFKKFLRLCFLTIQLLLTTGPFTLHAIF